MQDDGGCLVGGCTDSTAYNFNPSATYSLGTTACVLPTPGCTDTRASNYNPAAHFDDGSCVGASTCAPPGAPPPCAACETCAGGTNAGYRSPTLDQLPAPRVGEGEIVLDGDLRDWQRLGVYFYTDPPFLPVGPEKWEGLEFLPAGSGFERPAVAADGAAGVGSGGAGGG